MFSKRKASDFFKSKRIHQKVTKANKTITVGVAGASCGAGVTHLVLTIGNYIMKHRGKVALVEWGDQTGFKFLFEAINGCSYNGENKFSYRKVDYFPSYINSCLSDLKKEGYQLIVVDFGELTSKEVGIFNDMDIQLLVGRGEEWNYQYLMQIFQTYDDTITKGWRIVIPNGMNVITNILKKMIENKIYISPQCTPYKMDNESTKVLEEILGIR